MFWLYRASVWPPCEGRWPPRSEGSFVGVNYFLWVECGTNNSLRLQDARHEEKLLGSPSLSYSMKD